MSSEETMSRLTQRMQQSLGGHAAPENLVFWLGAGCSVHDGVPLMDELLTRILPAGAFPWGSPQFRFDQICEMYPTGPARENLLRPYFERTLTPDCPYHPLVRILRAGCADVVFTFNIDDLLEQALDKAGLREGHDYRVLDVPTLRPEATATMLRAGSGPRLRVVKLHGDYRSGFNFMTSTEIAAYDEQIRGLVAEFSRHPALVCGYSFVHLNVLTAFSLTGGPFFYVNKAFPDTPPVLSLMSRRSSAPLFVDAPLGFFDKFAAELALRLRV